MTNQKGCEIGHDLFENAISAFPRIDLVNEMHLVLVIEVLAPSIEQFDSDLLELTSRWITKNTI
jgi:hypothetical protein